MNIFRHEGRAVHFSDDGPRDGKALVFSNSLGTDLRVWEPLLPHLPPGYRILRYDTAGHGLSDIAGDRRIEDHAGDLAALMDHVGIARGVIIGLSVGGLIAQGLWKIRPDLIEGIVFCDTAHKIGTDAIWNDRIAAIEADGMVAVSDATLERWFTRPFREGDTTFPLWRSMLLRTIATGYCDLARSIRDADFTHDCTKLNIEALCVCGAEDGSTPPSLMRDFTRRLPRATYTEIPNCGHLPCIEQPENLIKALSSFLDRA
jgi:3-oxoadipate enol-lactonase